MTEKDFWRNSKAAVIGGGSWGTALANLIAPNCRETRLWVRAEEQARQINATRVTKYLPEMQLHERITAVCERDRALDWQDDPAHEGVKAIIWALPSKVCREQARLFARYFRGDEVILHASKGVEHGTMKRVSEILREELPCPRIGVISGPNLAGEISRGEPAATVVASAFTEVVEAGQALFGGDKFRIYGGSDVIGVEWAGTLKNVLAIASGALDGMKLGWNARAMLITRGLAEMVRFGIAMGAKESTFLGLAGVGDLLATCSSPLSRNYRVGFRLAQGEKLQAALAAIGSTAEGVETTRNVWEFARSRGIYMPITEGVHELLFEGVDVAEVLKRLMTRPQMPEF
jgi:glycerol-3-phosphate dehydrogenase (NAD(P)+)